MDNTKLPWTLLLTQEDIDLIDEMATKTNAGPSEVVHYALKLYKDVIGSFVDKNSKEETR